MEGSEIFFFFFFNQSQDNQELCRISSLDANLHANVSVGVVEFHLSASLDPSNHPGLMARDGRHDHAGRGLEVRGPVAQHNRWVLLDHRRALVNGGRHVAHGDVLAFDPRLAAEALDAAHGREARFELDQRIRISVS